jgi:DNA-binding transcriptional MerR regulator
MTKIYTTKDISGLLNVQPVTLKKYCQLLEKEGYIFTRNTRNHREYTDQDIIIFRKLLEVKDDTNTTLEHAVKRVMAWHEGIEVLPQKRYTDKRYETATFSDIPIYEQLKVELQALREEREKDREVIEKQGEALRLVLEELVATREQNEQLLSGMKEIQEAQKQIEYVDPRETARVQQETEEMNENIRYIRERMEIAATDKKKWQFWK